MFELFDLHCDSIVPMKERSENFLNATTQYSLKDRKEFKKACQTMAVFIPDEIRGEKAKEYFDIHYNYLKQLTKEQSDIVELANNSADIEKINSNNKTALFLSIESGAALAGKLENVDYFADCGVKMLTVVWNGENELASGHNTDKGFTEFGKKAVKRMEETGITVDVSHLNDRGFDELCEFATKPFIATHSNLRSICGHKRNLTDQQFCEIVKRGGLVGVNLFEPFLTDEGRGTEETLYKHVYKMLELGGENTIACGSDFDGADIYDSLNSPLKFAKFANYLSKKGISNTIIHKMFFDNAMRFFK